MSVRAAARAYGLDPDRLEPVASVYRPNAAYRAGRVLLKPFRYGERQLYYVTAALRHLERQGCRLVPRLIAARDGAPYIKSDDGWWYATTWIAGRPPRLPAELPAAATSLAAFHAAAEGCYIPYSNSRSWRRRWHTLLNDIIAFGRHARSGGTEFDRQYAAAAAIFVPQAEQALAALDHCGYDRLEAALRQRRGFCHRDLTAANLVVDAGGQICLVDPDTWGPELRVYDVARLLLAGEGGGGTGPLLQALSAYEASLPLDPRERRLLPWAYLLPREYWWAGVCRYRRPAEGVDPDRLLRSAVAAAPARATVAADLA